MRMRYFPEYVKHTLNKCCWGNVTQMRMFTIYSFLFATTDILPVLPQTAQY